MKTPDSFLNPKQNEPANNEPSLEEKAFIERIENIDTNNDAKKMIILTWKGLKPVSEFDFEKYDSDNDPDRLKQIAETEKLLTDLGLFYHRIQKELHGTHFDKEGKGTPATFYKDNYSISKNKEDLEYFVNHFGKKESTEVTKKLGKILGYPESAIEARNSPDRGPTILDPKSEQPELYSHEEMAFSKFRLSKQNWAEEFKTIQKWAQEIKRLDPKLYEDTIQNYRRVISGKEH